MQPQRIVRRFSVLSLAAAVLVAGPVPRARATTMLEIPLEELAATAPAIARGTVVRTASRYVLTPTGLELRTFTGLEVQEWLKGADRRRFVEINEAGGRSKEERWHIEGSPEYRPGEEVVVFLTEDPERPGLYRTHQMVQGQFKLRAGERTGRLLATRTFEGVALARTTEHGLRLQENSHGPGAANAIAPLPLEDLLDIIRRHGPTRGAAVPPTQLPLPPRRSP